MADELQPDEGFAYPEDLTALTAEELEGVEADAMAAFDDIDGRGDDVSDAEVAEMERLAAFVREVWAENDRRANEATERVARREAARAAINPPEDSEDTPEQQPDPDQEDEEEDDSGDGNEGEEGTPQAVAAGGTRLPARRRTGTVRSTRRVANPQPRSSNDVEVTITAGADISGVPAGSRLDDLTAVAKAFMARSKGFTAPPPNRSTGVFNRYGVATINRPVDADGLWDANPDFDSPQNIMDLARRESRLPGGSLTAAGGWCAPSTTIYDLCSNESLDGMVDAPEMNVTRGGIRYTPGPDFSEIYGAQCGFHLTEAQVIAGEQKNCCTVDCPDFQEIRMDVVGYCVKAPILTRAGFPELVRRWLEGTLIANAHQVNARIIAAMAAALGTATTAADAGTVTFNTLTALELAAEGLRYRWRMSRNETVEAIAPFWLRTAIRADLANRTGQPFSDAVSDAQIQAHFAARNVSIQWVYDWQDEDFVQGCPTAFPDTAEVLLYPAGTFVIGRQSVISLDTIYDTTDLMSNIFTAAFSEDGLFVAKTCFDGCRLEIPVCVSGRTGAADITACYGAAAVTP